MAKDKVNNTEENENSGFIEKILSFLGFSGPEAEKKRLLKTLSKEINRSRYKFYKTSSQEVLPGLARFFYEVYRTIAPAQTILTNESQKGSLKSFVIDVFLSEEQKKQLEMLYPESINEMSKTIPIQNIQTQVKTALIGFLSAFDADKTKKIDDTYSLILDFINFINFDFFFLLKKFDSNITERSFTYNPKFATISGDYIADDLHDFLEVFIPLNLDADWRKIFEALKLYRNIDVIQIDMWQKLIPAIRDVRSSGILENIIMHVKKNPDLVIEPRFSREHIVEPYIEQTKTQATLAIQKIAKDKRNSKIEEIAKIVFGTPVVLRCKNYTDKANVVFDKKMIPGFAYIQPINYLKAYYIDYFKRDIREIADAVIIRGDWSTNVLSQQLSTAYHILMETSDELIKFDESLAENGEIGSRLKNALTKSDRDRDYMKFVRQLVTEINEIAAKIMNKSAINLITVGKQLKILIEDHEKQIHEILLNWKDIENAYGKPIKESLTDSYKKIYYMIQLLQFFSNKK